MTCRNLTLRMDRAQRFTNFYLALRHSAKTYAAGPGLMAQGSPPNKPALRRASRTGREMLNVISKNLAVSIMSTATLMVPLLLLGLLIALWVK